MSKVLIGNGSGRPFTTWMQDLGCGPGRPDPSLLVVQYTKIFLVEPSRYLQAFEIDEYLYDFSGVCVQKNSLDRDVLFINVPGMSMVVSSLMYEYLRAKIPLPTMEIVCFSRGEKIIRRELIDIELFSDEAVRLAFAGMRFSIL